ncbi:hypothetical protein QMK19_32355 [Streptomyces sp. H10-C2]|uniref:hypothetical protein n=1 Tax=unclassified Streptomyces TaxID=2593676 RepID=UPI0024B9355B|nr:MULTISPECIES: hypothetical protein [unclassified Streptomyces]MDJ0346578.1 hypothetical protein [Streptomyces sp. PH10-H1]MDJ0374198.1 hypothetical protein [Streptomyces sp. H10-C2]
MSEAISDSVEGRRREGSARDDTAGRHRGPASPHDGDAPSHGRHRRPAGTQG